MRSDPHSDRPAVSFPGPVDRPETPCGEALPRRCCDPEKGVTSWSRELSCPRIGPGEAIRAVQLEAGNGRNRRERFALLEGVEYP